MCGGGFGKQRVLSSMRARHSVVGLGWLLLGFSVVLSSCGESDEDPDATGGKPTVEGGGGASGAKSTGGRNTGGAGAKGGAGTGATSGAGGSGPDEGGTNAGGASGAGGSDGGNAGSHEGGAGGQAGAGETCARCQHLPNVKPGVEVPCVDGKCLLPRDACERGFAHCSGDVSKVGCETDLSDAATCGSCSQRCEGLTPVCLLPGYVCGGCSPPRATACQNSCVNLSTDAENCGRCGVSCGQNGTCSDGTCNACPDGFAKCGGVTCSVSISTPENCGACGRKCEFDSTVAMCAVDARCEFSICKGGLANCDATPDDCETAFGTSSGCAPTYLDYLLFGPESPMELQVALAPDGSYYVAGWFNDVAAYDPGVDQDVRNPIDPGTGIREWSVRKYLANGTRAWIHTFNESVTYMKIAVGSDGSVVVARNIPYEVPDPSAPDTLFVDEELAIRKLSPAGGAVSWEHRFRGSTAGSMARFQTVAIDPAGAVVIAMTPSGEFDLDPGPAVDPFRSDVERGYLMKFAANGSRVWAKPIGDRDCGTIIRQLAFDANGIHAAGSAWSTCVLVGKSAPEVDESSPHFLLNLTNDGVPERVSWLEGVTWVSSLTAHTDGALVLAGNFAGAFYGDDPALPPLVRQPDPEQLAGFAWRVSASHESEWVKVLSPVDDAAAAPDDGVILALRTDDGSTLALLRPDGSPGWTARIGGRGDDPTYVVTNATHFLAAGPSGWDCDVDPGPGFVGPPIDSRFVARYRY